MKARVVNLDQQRPASKARGNDAPLGPQGVTPEPEAPLFEGVFLAGFECSCHVLECGRRLDLLTSTRHDEFAALDYARIRQQGMTACREGVSWVQVARAGGEFDFSGVLPRLRAARELGIRVIWDLMHFGWPCDVDPFSPRFPLLFGRYAKAFADFYASESDEVAIVAPINEISFLSWAGGDMGIMNPFAMARSDEMKVQFVRATIEAIEAIRAVLPDTRFMQPEPVIHIVPDPAHPKTWRRVECDRLFQLQTWDMLRGDVWPTLGGNPSYLDIVGVNFYPDNQFMLDGTTIQRGEPRYRPFSEMLLEVARRYERPMLIAETGAEGDARAPWLAYVCEQSRLALEADAELHGITLYPVLNHPGWVDDRRCENGLWDYADDAGERALHTPLATELAAQAPELERARARMLERKKDLAIPA